MFQISIKALALIESQLNYSYLLCT